MENKEQFKALFRAWVKRPGAEELLEWLESTDFFEAPASTKFHGAYHGGLLEHSLNVCRELLESDINKSVSTESLVICGLLHDVCKAGVYHPETKRRRDPDTGRWEDYQGYTFSDPFPFGHGEKSVCLIARFIGLTKEEALAIRWHMGPYDDAAGSHAYKDARRYANQRYPLVIALHDADMEATQKEKEAEYGRQH